MKYARNIIAIFWFLVWIISCIYTFYFVVKGNIVWASGCSFIFGYGVSSYYNLIWNSASYKSKQLNKEVKNVR